MKLNKKQKQFLFDNNYISAKTLDAAVEPGWKEYYIKNFTWNLTGKDRYGFELLYLEDKKSGDIEYTIGLNFQGNDKERLGQL